MADLQKDLLEKNISVTLTDNARNYLAEKGYDKKFGARPLKRLIRKEIESKLADMYIDGELKKNGNVNIDCKDGNLIFN